MAGITKDDLVAFFQRHLVPLCTIFTVENKASIDVATSFILSAADEWFLVTAGHVALGIKGYLQNPKYCLEKVFLYDYGGIGALHHQPIPFELTSEDLIIMGDETTFDYAVIHLREYYKKLLIANKIVPLNEEVWLHQPKNPQFFVMLGIPKQRVLVEWNKDKSAINNVDIPTVLLHVEHAPKRPAGLIKRSSTRWYGYVKLDPSIIDDISGMSGGPIFAFKQTDNGELRYWLIGVQSSWNKGNKAIAACPAQNLGAYLADMVNKIKEMQAN